MEYFVPTVQLTNGLREEAFLDCLPLGVCLLKSDWTVVFWNRRLEEWSQIHRTQILGKSLFAQLPWLANSDYERSLQLVFQRGEASSLSSEQDDPFSMFVGGLRDERHYRAHFTAVPSEEFGCSLALMSIEDVSDWHRQIKLQKESQLRANQDLRARRMAETAFDRLGRLHELILQSAGNGIVGLDHDGNTLFANPAAAKMLGWEIEELVGRSMHANFGGCCPKGNDALGQGCFSSSPIHGGARQFVREDWFQKKDGTRFPVEYLRMPIVEDGAIVGAVVTFSDISDRRLLEQEVMRYTEKLEEEVDRRAARIRELEQRRMEVEKLAALAQVAAGVAHEINNPLAGIKNAFRLVKGSIPDTHPRARYVGLIENEIDRISGITKRMYQLYQPDPAVLRAVNLHEILHDVSLMIGPALKDSNSHLEIVAPQSMPLVRLPVRDITQVLCNLVHNAIQASSGHQNICLTAETDDQGIRLVVTDQAGGIANDVLPHIFEPFFTTKSGAGQGGMGLGLSVSRSLIESLGGRIDVQTVPTVGTTFIIHLPYTIEAIRESCEPAIVMKGEGHG
ncbi:PAS domain-containing sensor histidine kinase [Candidatus Nitronereus thalassa]|uniref:histidine kinase n=1 Tax=Candidatus Nitronereus thalassa TaxID=3020898 RepID=A0ABU3K6Z6_9BACT|nr:ATP-binding protein [Candidatus Nitronereus thalassa]MDT7042127.1 ATP-binding protein [Candidatus Nitronereus thalassa]